MNFKRMRLGVFEQLPDELVEHICWRVHQSKMDEIFRFIRKYLPDPSKHPDRFTNYYLGPEFLRTSAKLYGINPVGRTSFHLKHTTLEAMLVHHMISPSADLGL